MSDVISFTERKWDSNRDVAAHTVVDMLRVAIARIERGEMQADHAILCTACVEDNGAVSSGWLQVGEFHVLGQLGLLERIKIELINGAEHFA